MGYSFLVNPKTHECLLFSHVLNVAFATSVLDKKEIQNTDHEYPK
jgi:hypothetical protein